MTKRCVSFLIGLAMLTALQSIEIFPAAPVSAAETSRTELAPEPIEAKIKEIEADATLDEPQKSELTAEYKKALSYLEAARSNKAAADAFMQSIKQAPIETERLNKIVEKVRAAPPSPDPSSLSEETLAELEQRLANEKANLASVETKLADFEQQLETQRNRPAAARQRLIELKQQQDELANQIESLNAIADPSSLNEAQRWKQEAQASSLRSEVRMLDQELLSQSARVALVTALREQAALSAQRLGLLVRQLEEAINQQRSAAAEQTLAETAAAQHESVGKHPIVQQLANQNAALSNKLQRLAAVLEEASAGDDMANERAKQIREEFNNSREKLRLAGIYQALGRILAEQRRALPDLRELEKTISRREAMIAETSLGLIQNEEEKKRLHNVDAFVTELTSTLPPDQAERVRSDVPELVQQREALLERAIKAQKAYLKALGELDFAQRQLLSVVDAYDKFLSERLLWIRSAPPPNIESLRALPDQIARILSPTHWLEVTDVLITQSKRSPVIGLAIVLVVALLVMARSMRGTLQALGNMIGNPATDQFAYTLKALGLTLLLAVPWPMLLAALGWQLRFSPEATEFSRAIGLGLLVIALPHLNLRTLSVLCLPNGVAASHFRWPDRSLKPLRRQVHQMVLLFIPATFVFVVVTAYDGVDLGGGLGRFCFLLMMFSLGVFFFRLFDPKAGVMVAFKTWHSDTLLARWNTVWLLLSVAVPFTLAVLSVLGFVDTAVTLTSSLIDTLWLAFGLILLQQLGTRWLLLTRGKLAIQAAIQRRAALRAQQEAGQSDQLPIDSVLAEEAEPDVDLASLNEQSRKLLNVAVVVIAIVGLWTVWSDVVPALGILDNIELWHYAAVESGEQKMFAVTLADVAVAILIAIVTVVAANRLPAFIEIILLKRFEIDSGSRNATTTLLNYAIITVGIVLFFNKLGGNWSQIQWLLAALSVGIGFGLQEIVANFISGIIILFERPVRVGDVVTVGDTDGVVTKIRIRATTIRNWDRKELLVPNKEFITGRLLNWSLSDQMTRVVIVVGVAYGSDVDKALALMREAAEEHEHVLDDPAPVLSFEGFGDNALTLIVRAYLGSIDYRISTITDLHKAINRKFEQSGIIIAFPQRDLHLDSSQPLDVRIQRNSSGAADR